ncbi:C_GCAxxG_C_C family protein [bacterium]|nr:C_GCAxxG_C_C family protein [bacterium]
MLDPQERREKAMAIFSEGYNCSQSVVKAFADLLPIEEESLLRLASSFGGGMGRLREVCGSVSGMFMAAGLLQGYAGPAKGPVKNRHYANIQHLAQKFKELHGSIVCRELLHKPPGPEAPQAEERTPEYYKKRPCREIVGSAAFILAQYLNESEAAAKTEDIE